VVDISSNKEDIFLDTSRGEEFARRLFDDLNHGLLGPPDDGNAIILSDSNKEEEVCEDDTADIKAAPPSVVNSLAPTVSAANADNAPDGVQDDSNGGRTSDRVQGDSCDGRDNASFP
jgi:hypothetical protein